MPDPPATTPTQNLLWYTDRSRFKTATSRCARQRYLSYHAGPTGYGLRHRSESLPLATGLSAHDGVARFAEILIAEDRLPVLEEVRAIIQDVQHDYLMKVEEKGFLGILGGEATAETIQEQKVLISGLLWALRLKFLPWFHQTYRLLESEKERVHFLECGCGAPALDAAEHVRRGCTGKVLMIRNDLLGIRREAPTLGYFEIKTTGWESAAWSEQWETDYQLGLGTLDIGKIYPGKEVTELYIVGLGKGRRQKDRYDGSTDERKKQQSPLCYGFCRPSNPPLDTDDWLWAYEWVDAEGATKRKTRAHKRRGIWELAESDWPIWRAYQQNEPAITPEEFWVRMLPDSLLEKVVFLLGPMNRQDHQIQAVRRSMVGEEDRWQEILWRLYELQAGGQSWASEAFQAELDRLVPCSWDCRRFGKDHQCEFVPICHREIGWEDPIGNGKYEPRRPHHEPELAQMKERGYAPPDWEADDDEESP